MREKKFKKKPRTPKKTPTPKKNAENVKNRLPLAEIV